MAILKGFPPSNTISPGIRLPICSGCNKCFNWHDVAQGTSDHLGNNTYRCFKCYKDKEEADPCIIVIDK